MDIEHLTSRRHLAWPACYNARDLGGLPAGDGRQTRWRSIVRSDYLNRLTDVGRQAVLDYGIRTVIDLRGPHEVAKEPAIAIQGEDHALDYRNLPLDRFYPEVGALISQAKTHVQVYRLVLDHYPDAVTEIMRAIDQAEPGGIVLHCHAGKDRTGMVTALLLRLSGVPDQVIAADYAASQVRLWPLYEKYLAESAVDPDDFWNKPVATEDTMYSLLDYLDTQHGGVEGYLSAAGLSDEELDRLNRRLLAS